MTSATPSPNGQGSSGQPAGGNDGPTGDLSTAQLAVEGMHCESCVLLIEEVLAERPGVSSSSVDLESALATVAYDPSRLGLDDLRSAIEEAGYSATPVG
jgi:copper chaperone CopZ